MRARVHACQLLLDAVVLEGDRAVDLRLGRELPEAAREQPGAQADDQPSREEARNHR